MAHFLQSDYWSPGDLARIYNELNVYINDHPGDPAGEISVLAKFVIP